MANLSYPFPAVGEVHNYEYLFLADASQGETDGRKARPVLVVAADPGIRRVFVVPVTTKGEVDGSRTMAIPVDVGRAMGLPRPEESLLLTDEANTFIWTGYDLRPVPKTNGSKFGKATPGFTNSALRRLITAGGRATRR